MGFRRKTLVALAFLAASGFAGAQVIEFESNGLKYQTLTKNGVTIMYATLPDHIREYSILQVAISNGSSISWSIKPEDFHFHRDDGVIIEPTSASGVITNLMEKATRGDVIKLVSTYEASIYGNTRMHSTNGYEARRRAAFAEEQSTKIKAAAAASAIALVPTKLKPGDSTDGAVFYPTSKPLGTGHLVVNAAGEVFEFHVTHDTR